MKNQQDEFIVDFVKLESGNIPFIQFLDSLTNIEKYEILALIEEFRLIKTNNEQMPLSMSRYLRDGIFELRARHQTRNTRSLYFFLQGKQIVFTNGFIKKTEKTRNEEIEKAIKYKKIYVKGLAYE